MAEVSTERRLFFGQLVIGPPGSGKTTYCKRMAEILNQLGRETVIINIDPANEISLPYEPAINITSLIRIEEVMESLKLGPNGSLMYAMNYLEANLDWLLNGIKNLPNQSDSHPINESNQSEKQPTSEPEKQSTNESNQSNCHQNRTESTDPERNPYIIFDCPGQIELYTHDESFRKIVRKLTDRREADFRLVAVYLVDAHYCNDGGKFISSLLSTLSAMLHLELPHVNVMSKVDLISKYGKTRFGLNYFCEVLDLNYLVEELSDDPFLAKFRSLSKCLAETIENYGLVSFSPLNINDNNTLIRILRLIDKANGYYLTDIKTQEQMDRLYRDHEAADFEYCKYGTIDERFVRDQTNLTELDQDN